MRAPRLLVIEGNTEAARARHKAAGGEIASVIYSDLLRHLSPGAVVDICYPADPGANLPDSGGLEGYDGVAITGSALNIYDGGPHIAPQIALTREVFASGTPLFGSCWGLQLITVAAGGVVRRNPKGREIGFGRRIRVTEAGRGHPMLAGKGDSFDAVTVHLDEVETLAPGTTVLASNAVSAVQAAELKHAHGTAWGVQYHPEYPLREIGAIVRRQGQALVDEGFFSDTDDLSRWVSDVTALDAGTAPKAVLWRHGLDASVTDEAVRAGEIANWLKAEVAPGMARRGRV
jgi:GMP synthase (glutamine-hydrolysing)